MNCMELQFSSVQLAHYSWDKISAAQIQHYFKDASGKKDWSKRAWAEWCTMEKGLHQESMEQLSEVKSPFIIFLIKYIF